MRKLLYVLIASVFFIGCEEEVQLDLKNTDPLLVVEGLITDQQGPYTVMLTMSTDYFGEQFPPKVSGALVTITEDSILTDTLLEVQPGIYETQKIPLGQVGSKYDLLIIESDKEYRATTTLNPVSGIDSLTFQYREGLFYETDGIYVQTWGQEPEGVGDYYRWLYYSNDTIAVPTDILVADDEFVDGSYIGDFEVFFQGAHDFDPYLQDTGDIVRIEQYSITKEAFNFYEQLHENKEFGNLFDVPPTNITGNISNGAWGLFEASSVVSAEITIE